MSKTNGKHSISNNKPTKKSSKTINKKNTKQNKEVASKKRINNQVHNTSQRPTNKATKNKEYNKKVSKQYAEYNINDNKNKKKKKGKRKIGRKIILVLFLVLITLFAIRMTENGWTYGGFAATILGHDSKTVESLDPIYILVTGESQGLTDTIMLCEYNPKTNKANLISIPRDTFIGQRQGSATANDKINTLYSKSPEKLLEKVNEITGLNVKYYMNIDTKGLRDLIDAMGGIYFDVPMDMDYDDDTQDLHIHLKAGYQLLDGNKAEQVVRFRHNNDGSSYPASYGDNDIGRMKTQRAFIETLMKQLLSKKSIFKINKYSKIMKKYVKTNFEINDFIHYVPYMFDFKMEDLNSQTLPGSPKLCNGVWLFIPNDSEVKTLIKQLD